MSLTDAFRSGLVQRWHNNPDMAHVDDPICAHSGRVARIIAMLHPAPSAALLIAALTHDDGEIATSDVSGPVKATMPPEVLAWLTQAEADARTAIWGADPALTERDAEWLQFADKLDARMMAARHAPDTLNGDGWPEADARLATLADRIGVEWG